MNAIEANCLTKKFGSVTAVDSLSLEVRSGELFSLLGVNGAGKTTTIRMLSCLLKPTSGDARLCGRSIVSEPGEVKKLINLSPQETAVARNLTVRENLEMIAGIYGSDRRKSRELAGEMISAFALEQAENRKARVLSGGMQRRLSIAMALITSPKVLFLDEPTLGLDVIARKELWNVIESLHGKVTVILTTHYMEEAQALSDRIGVMAGGRLRALGTLDELLALSGEKDLENAFIKIASEVSA